MSFRTEAEMSERLRVVLGPTVASEGISISREVNGDVGIPDYLLVKFSNSSISYVVAVELKLRDWRRGLVQAFRYRNFTNEVYLILDHNHLRPAIANADRFVKAGIGLASLDADGRFEIHVLSQSRTPFSAYLSSRVAARLVPSTSGTTESCMSLRFTKSIAGRRSFRKLRCVIHRMEPLTTSALAEQK